MLCCTIPLLVVAIGAGPEGLAMQDVVRGNNRFGFDLYGKIRPRPGNLVFSPYSISTALAMTRVGANGVTAKEMDETLHLPADAPGRDSGFAALKGAIGSIEGGAFQLSTANALWGRRGLDYRADFLGRAEASYGAGLRQVDFEGDPEGSRKAINAWVESRTHDRVKELLSKSDVREDTDLILTNAIYFKASWATTFPRSGTTDEPFRDGKSSGPVPTMHLSGQFAYFEGEGLQLLGLPYVGRQQSMLIALPGEVDGLASLEASLSIEKFDGWVAKLGRRRVEVALPRFRLETGVELAGVLGSLGMTSAFGRGADFSGIATDRRLFLGAVIHKAFAEVNEEGTEAAAATAVVMMKSAAMAPVQPPVVFRADRPFLFAIRDDATGSILFLGRVARPEG